MGSLLGDLALGLRQAAGVLSPKVQEETFAADERGQARLENVIAQRDQMERQFQLQQATPQAAMARQQLENEVGFRNAVKDAGGDQAKIASAAVQFGKPELAVSIFNQQENRQAQLDAKREALAQRMTELQIRMEDKAATREQQAQYQQMLVGLRQQSLAAQQEAVRGRLELQGMRLEMAGRAAGDKAAMDREKAQNKAVTQLGTAVEKADISNVNAALAAAEQAIQNKDVANYLTGPKSLIPDAMLPPDIRQAKQDITRLFNITLKQRSGAAVTNQELDRLKQEFGQGLLKTPDQVTKGIERFREILDKHTQGVVAGFGKDALDAYNDNLKSVGGTPLLSGASPKADPGGPPKIANDEEFAKLAPGTVFIGPDGKQRKKP